MTKWRILKNPQYWIYFWSLLCLIWGFKLYSYHPFQVHGCDPDSWISTKSSSAIFFSTREQLEPREFGLLDEFWYGAILSHLCKTILGKQNSKRGKEVSEGFHEFWPRGNAMECWYLPSQSVDSGLTQLIRQTIFQPALGYVIWLVVYLPLWKIWVRQWEGWHPIYEMENKTCSRPPTSNDYLRTRVRDFRTLSLNSLKSLFRKLAVPITSTRIEDPHAWVPAFFVSFHLMVENRSSRLFDGQSLDIHTPCHWTGYKTSYNGVFKSHD